MSQRVFNSKGICARDYSDPPMHEYAFDVKLAAVVRVKAVDEQAARDAMTSVLESCEPTAPFIDGFNHTARDVELMEFSLDSKYPNLFQVDGEDAKSELPDACEHRETGGGICLDCGHDTVDDEDEET